MNKILIFILTSFLITSCLQTRDSLRKTQDGELSEAAKLQQKNAINESRFFEIDRDFRQLYGRVEVLEHQIGDGQKNKSTETNDRFEKLEKKVSLLEEALVQLENNHKKSISKPLSSDAKESSHFTNAVESFNNKKWEDAIYSFDEYRKANPKGSKYAEATYKMGLSFLNLGMKNDAKSFFDEVVQKFPKSKESDLAKVKIKSL